MVNSELLHILVFLAITVCFGFLSRRINRLTEKYCLMHRLYFDCSRDFDFLRSKQDRNENEINEILEGMDVRMKSESDHLGEWAVKIEAEIEALKQGAALTPREQIPKV